MNSPMIKSFLDLPDWIHICNIMILLIVTTLLGYLTIFEQGDTNDSAALPEWKRTANNIVRKAITEQDSKQHIRSFIKALSHESAQVRQNATWALHYETGLPWAEKTEACKEWWKHSRRQEKSREPSPKGGTITKTQSAGEIGLGIDLQVASKKTIRMDQQDQGIPYTITVTNNNPSSISFLPPSVLPYRAFRYGRGDKKIPVYQQYGPSVLVLQVEILDQRGEEVDVEDRVYYYHPIGNRSLDPVNVKEQRGIRMTRVFPVPASLTSLIGTEGIIRFRLYSQDLLVEQKSDRYRVHFPSIVEEVHLQWKNKQ